MRCWSIALLVLAANVRCGGSATPSESTVEPSDAGTDRDASVSPDSWQDSGDVSDSPGDEFDPNAYEGYHVVDGGSDCGAAEVPAGHNETRTCCGGVPCEGLCVIGEDSSNPFCYCAAIIGGCPAEASVCCVFEHRCTPPEGCSVGLP